MVSAREINPGVEFQGISLCVCVCVCVCYHGTVVEECKRRLVAGGYKELSERETWKLAPEGKVCVCSIPK